MASDAIIPTVLQNRLVSRFRRVHEMRGSMVAVGPPGIGKSTAIRVFQCENPRNVMYTRVMKRGVTGPQVLQQFLGALRHLDFAERYRFGREPPNSPRSTAEVVRGIASEIEAAGGRRHRDFDPDFFPKLTIVFDEAQRLTNGAIDALRDWNEPHYFCAGTFPIGMIFVGNDELSLEASRGGLSIIDQGMQDRLLYAERLSYDDVEHADIERFARERGIDDDRAIAAIVSVFAAPRAQRSFRRITNFLDELRDEAGGGPITRDTVRALASLSL